MQGNIYRGTCRHLAHLRSLRTWFSTFPRSIPELLSGVQSITKFGGPLVPWVVICALKEGTHKCPGFSTEVSSPGRLVPGHVLRKSQVGKTGQGHI